MTDIEELIIALKYAFRNYGLSSLEADLLSNHTLATLSKYLKQKGLKILDENDVRTAIKAQAELDNPNTVTQYNVFEAIACKLDGVRHDQH